MGRSKKNWDHLVDHSGNYGIDVKNGLYPAIKGTLKGATGQKGEPGKNPDKGQKGEEGKLGGTGRKGEPGDSIVGPQGEGFTFDDLTQAQKDDITGPAGQKGDTGDKGDEAVAPMLFFKGQVDALADLPGGATTGDSYYVTDKFGYYAWDGTEWVPVGNAIKGQKGMYGEKGSAGQPGSAAAQGEKGEPGKNGTNGLQGSIGPEGKSAYDSAVDNGFVGTEVEWLESLKGDRGDDLTGSPIDLTDYYTKDEVDDAIQFFDTPEAAFNYYKHSTQDHVLTGNISFAATDRTKPIYDQGCAMIDSNATIAADRRPPFKNLDRMLLVNYVIYDPLGSRSNQYSLIQVIYTDDEQEQYQSFVRRAQPAQNQFTDWQVNSFDPNLYYTKKELVSLLNSISDTTYEVRADLGPDASTAKLTLREKAGSGLGDSNVVFEGINGINVRRENGRIVFDTGSISGLNYIGPIQAGDDPDDRATDPHKGDFLLYLSGGVAWNGDRVSAGDMVAYTPSFAEPWHHIFIGGETGVISVDVSGVLELEGDETNPVIALPEDKVVNPEELDETLVNYAKWRDVIETLRPRKIGSLSDVESGNAILGTGGSFGTQVDSIPDPPMTKGTYFPNRADRSLTFSQNDVLGRGMEQLFNEMLPDQTEIRIASTEGDYDITTKILEKDFDGKNYKIIVPQNYIINYIDDSDAGFNINILLDFETPDNSILVYDEATRKWYPEPKGGVFTENEADAKYLPQKGPATFGGVLDIDKDGAGEAGLNIDGKLKVVDEIELSGPLHARRGYLSASNNPLDAWKADTPHGIVTLAKLEDYLTDNLPPNFDYLPLTGGDLFGPLTLSQSLDLIVSAGDATISARGSSDAALVFAVQEGETQIKDVLSLDPNVARFYGLRVTGLDTAREYSDALSFGQAKTLFMPIVIDGENGTPGGGSGSLDGDISVKGYGRLTIAKDSFAVEVGGTNLLLTQSEGVKFTKAFSDSITGDYEANELTTYQTVVDLVSDVKFTDAPANGGAYVRKNNDWTELNYADIIGTPPPSEGGGGIDDVPGQPRDELYLRKALGAGKGGEWVVYEPATAEDVPSLPTNPVRGTIYITSSNVVAIGI